MYLLPEKITRMFKRLPSTDAAFGPDDNEGSEASITENKWKRRWRSLNPSQRYYFVAAVLALGIEIFYDSTLNTMALPVILIIIGLLKEFAPRFADMWNSLYGKAVILLFYAIVANFALANAGGMVNEVTGVAASDLPFSHNFALIINLPSWFLVTTVLALVVFNIATPFYLLLLLFLKPFGVHGIWHKPEYKYVFTTAFLRYVLSFFLLVYVAMIMEEVGASSNQSTSWGHVSFGQTDSEDVVTEGADAAADDAGESLDESEQQEEEIKVSGFDYEHMQRSLLVGFIYNFEADVYSRCEHPEDARVIELNDFEILTVTPDKSTKLGYRYEVIACRSVAIGRTVAAIPEPL